MIPAPKENAVGDRRLAKYFSWTASFSLVPTKAKRGRMVQNNTTGAAMAASFELLKNTDIKKARVISDIQNKKKNINNKDELLLGKKLDAAM